MANECLRHGHHAHLPPLDAHDNRVCPEIVDHKRFRSLPSGSKFKQLLTLLRNVEQEDRELSKDLSFCHRLTHQCGRLLYAKINHPFAPVNSLELTTCYGDSL
jgi:hypothetical protein